MVPVENKTKERATLESKSRFCGNEGALQLLIFRTSHAFISSFMFLHSYSCYMLIGETLNENDVELSERERMSLGLDLRAVVTSDTVDNFTLRNETRSILTKSCIEYGIIYHNHNKSKVKVKETAIAEHNSSTDNPLKERGSSDDEHAREEVDNTPAEKVENKLRTSLEKEFKKCLKYWRELARGINWAEEFP